MDFGTFRQGGRTQRSGVFAAVLAAGLTIGGIATPHTSATGAPAQSGPPHLVRSTSEGHAGATDSATLSARVVGIAAAESGGGYWEVAADGGVFAAGDARFAGPPAAQRLASPIVGITADALTGGYWEVASDGAISGYDAPNFGSATGKPLAAPVVGMAAAPDGDGYWEVASDGAVAAFGDATFYGSAAQRSLGAPVVGMAAAPDGGGYWEVASDGAVAAFGDATFYGSADGKTSAAPIVAMAVDAATGGYWEVASDGGLFAFHAAGDGAPPASALSAPVTGLAATPKGKGYWEVASNGDVIGFGAARSAGSAQVVVAAHAYLPPDNPPANVTPTPTYTFQAGTTVDARTSLPCWTLRGSDWVPRAAADRCVTAEVEATNNARAKEGLTPMRLPSDFGSLTPEEQLFVLTDIARVSRGERPAIGLSPLLDGYAQEGAAEETDPEFDFGALPSATWWGSNWVSGALNALDANYTWVYDDGYGGYNVDCPVPGAPGCWGHRDNVLVDAAAGTLVMGAGDVGLHTGLHTGLQSMTELFVIVQDPAEVPPLSYTWAEAVAAGAAG